MTGYPLALQQASVTCGHPTAAHWSEWCTRGFSPLRPLPVVHISRHHCRPLELVTSVYLSAVSSLRRRSSLNQASALTPPCRIATTPSMTPRWSAQQP
eukprot:scaffold192672_cov31-Tisochrysis_lutea.AAC.2